jgi:hypothetical protein
MRVRNAIYGGGLVVQTAFNGVATNPVRPIRLPSFTST